LKRKKRGQNYNIIIKIIYWTDLKNYTNFAQEIL